MYIPPFVHLLPAACWAVAGPLARSRELTPLYVERFVGPHAAVCRTTHEYWELICVLGGEGEMLGDAAFPLHAGLACLIPPGVGHMERSSAVMDVLWVGLAGARLEAGRSSEPPGVARANLDATARPVAERLWTLGQRGFGPLGPELDGLALALVAGLWRRVAESAGAGPAAGDRIAAAVAWLNTNFAADLDVADLAAQAGCSEGHFHRLFHQRTGQTPGQYLTAVRLREAWRWLRNTTVPVHRIARLCGYHDAHYFSNVFHRHAGLTPRAARHLPAEAG